VKLEKIHRIKVEATKESEQAGVIYTISKGKFWCGKSFQHVTEKENPKLMWDEGTTRCKGCDKWFEKHQ
jgi:hypothetical protein